MTGPFALTFAALFGAVIDNSAIRRFLHGTAPHFDAFAFRPSDGALVIGDRDNRLAVFDPSTGILRYRVALPHAKGVTAVAFASRPAVMVTADGDGLVVLLHPGRDL